MSLSRLSTCDNCGRSIQDADEILCRSCKPSLQTRADIAAKQAEIDSAYWRFSRGANAKPPARELYVELNALKDKLRKEQG